MKLKNKKTGEIVNDGYVRETHDFQFDGQKHVLAVFKSNGHRPPERVSGAYKSLAELNAEWEDYEEPKEHWYINENGAVLKYIPDDPDGEDKAYMKYQEVIGNYFETREEAEKAVEKLKAVKRLKDKGFRFDGWKCTGSISFTFDNYYGDGQPMSASDDLNLLFGGEE